MNWIYLNELDYLILMNWIILMNRIMQHVHLIQCSFEQREGSEWQPRVPQHHQHSRQVNEEEHNGGHIGVAMRLGIEV